MPALGCVDPTHRGTSSGHHCAKPCVKCPHPSAGPPLNGSPNVFIQGKAVLRATGPAGNPDGGTHDAGQCCGPNKWVCATAQNRGVYINGILAFCATDKTQHCTDGTFGTLNIGGSPFVFVGT